MKLTLREIEAALLGAAETPEELDREVAHVRTDSREVGPGDLFVCIEGETFDGHQFAEQAVGQGAIAVLSSQFMPDLDTKVFMVRDTLRGLGDIAGAYRDKTRANVVAVTGSAGKTTAKEMLFAVAEAAGPAAKNAGNFNNQIGLPLSILAASLDDETWVLEAGISVPGDMDDLGRILRPDVAVVLNVGAAHLEGLGDIAGVAREKSLLLKYLKPGGTAAVCADYPELVKAARAHDVDTLWFSSKDRNADVFCSFEGMDVGMGEDGRGRYLLRTNGFEETLHMEQCGEHIAENIAAVAASARLLGIGLDVLKKGLDNFSLPGQRFACRATGGTTLIDDSYNANPLSMSSAIRTAKRMAGKRPLVLVLGDMKELGGHAAQAHEDLGREAREAGASAIFFFGSHVGDVARGFGDNGVKVDEVSTPDDVVSRWRKTDFKEAVVLIKGSRSCRMEEYARALAKKLDAETGGEQQ